MYFLNHARNKDVLHMKSKTYVTQPFRMSLTLATAPQTLHGREKTLQGEASATSNFL